MSGALPGGPPSSWRRHGAPARWAPDLWLLASSLAAGIGAARLTQAPGAGRVVGPIVATVVVGHVATSGARRLRAWTGLALASGVVAVVLAAIWGELFSATRSGLPTVTTWHALVTRFDQAGTVIRSNPTPVPATPGVVLCIAVGAGLMAVAARTIWAAVEVRAARPLAALWTLVPSFGLFCYTALLSSQVDRLAGAVTYLVAGLAFILAADRPPAVHGSAGGTRTPPPTGRVIWTAALGTVVPVLTVALAVAVPASVSPALSSLKVDAVPFGRNGAPGAGGVGLGTGTTGPGGTAGGGAGGPGPAGGGDGLGPNSGPPALGVRTIDLVDNLQAVLTDRTSELMFSATSPVPTYWQVALLTHFNGTAWLPDSTTMAAVQAIPVSARNRQIPGLPALPEPAPTSTFRTTVTIGDLESTLLPLSPTTVSVDTEATLVPEFGAVQQVETPPGERYTAVARTPVAPPAAPGRHRSGSTRSTASAHTSGHRAASGGAASGGHARGATLTGAPMPSATEPASADTAVSAGTLAPYLQLPTVAAPVVRLARQIVAGASTAAAKAAALARWFNSGRYRYTLSPPSPPRGTDPLSYFLLTSHAGFCQQFAAAYAVMARVDGLPARVAVGFTTGAPAGHDTYRVTGADAHVWPEVYLGPSVGWTSYEPTPATTGEPGGVGVNSGARPSSSSPAGRPTGATVSTVTPSHHFSFPRPPVPSTVAVAGHGRRAGAIPGTRRHGSRSALVLAVTLGATAVIGLAGLLAVRRRSAWPARPVSVRALLHRRRHPHADPTEEVLAQWSEAQVSLERLRLGRRPEETIQEHAARLQRLVATDWLAPPAPPVGDGPAAGVDPVEAYEHLAALAARALYDTAPCSPEDARRAGDLGIAVRAGMPRRSAPGRITVGV